MLRDEYNFTLSISNLKNLPLEKYENNFTFIADGKRYQTNRIVADLLSPILKNLHFIDSTINEFYINTNIKNNIDENLSNDDIFQEFLELAYFSNVKIDSKRQNFFSEYFFELGNTEEYFNIQREFLKTLTTENVIDRLHSIIENSLKKSTDFIEIKNEMINFAALHFESINHDQLKTLDISTLDSILSNESLKLRDEDSLLDFILSLYEDNCEYSVLFEYVQFSNISENYLISFIQKFEIEYINEKIWNSICYRLLHSKSEYIQSERYQNFDNKKQIDPEIYNVKEFKYSEFEKFNGIMNFLSKETGGNINDNGTIEISSNSIISDFHPKNLVDYDKNNYYHSKDEGDAFICFDFKDKLIQLSSYSIKTNNSKAFGTHLKNWIIEVSNDGLNWKEIDRHESDSSLNGPNFIANFMIHQEQNDFYRFIRLKFIMMI